MAQNSKNLKYERRLKYYYLRFLRLRGEPHELAFGIAIGVFSGMMPVLPAQIIFAVALAILFKASKITAAIGTWVSNPLNWYFIYVYDFKLGAYLLGIEGGPEIIRAVTDSINRGDPMSVVWGKLFSSGNQPCVSSAYRRNNNRSCSCDSLLFSVSENIPENKRMAHQKKV